MLKSKFQHYRDPSSPVRLLEHNMSKETNGSLGVCITCDRRNLGGANYSRACCATTQEAVLCSSAPVPSTSSECGTSRLSSKTDKNHGFYLPPAINFETYKSMSKKSPPHTYRSPFKARDNTCKNSAAVPQKQPRSSLRTISAPRHPLMPSFFEPSDLIIENNPTQHDRPSDQAMEELKNYAGSFDQIRNWKRRVSSG